MSKQITTEGKYIQFINVGNSPSGKTHIWEIKSKEGNCLLGLIKWNGKWRCYSHYIYPYMFADSEDFLVFEKQCERDIANFCEYQTKSHKKLKEIKN